MTKRKRRIYERSIRAHDRYMSMSTDQRGDKRCLFFADGWTRLVNKAFSTAVDHPGQREPFVEGGAS